LRAIELSVRERFRPILLTSITTFAGLAPLLLETSLNAQFLKPMAISLAFGILFATFITLILVPVIFRIKESADKLKSLVHYSFNSQVSFHFLRYFLTILQNHACKMVFLVRKAIIFLK